MKRRRRESRSIAGALADEHASFLGATVRRNGQRIRDDAVSSCVTEDGDYCCNGVRKPASMYTLRWERGH